MLGPLQGLLRGAGRAGAYAVGKGATALSRGFGRITGNAVGAIAGTIGNKAGQFWLGGDKPVLGTILSGFGKVRSSAVRSAAQFGGLYGAGSAIEQLADTNWGKELSPASRAGLSLAATGLKFTGYRKLVQGVASTSLRAAGAIRGDVSRYGQADQAVRRFLGGFATSGSALNAVGRFAGRGALNLAAFPVKTAARAGVGLAGMTFAGLRGAGRFARLLGYGGKEAAAMAGRTIYPAVNHTSLMTRVRNVRSKMTGPLFEMPLMHNRAMKALGITSQTGELPVYSPGFALGAAGGMAAGIKSYYDGQRARVNPSRPGMIGPHNFPGGMSRIRRGAVPNVAPALTLQMHYGRRRVM